MAPTADAHMEDSFVGEETQPTQLATQSEPHPSQQVGANEHLWGALIPTNRRHEKCEYQLKSPKISNVHCTITWRGGEGGDPREVLVTDMSTNGTFINGVRIGKGHFSLLEQGNELAFGATQQNVPEDDHRYMYRHFGNPDNKSGGIFDVYQLSTELGRGAFASVRRAVGITDGKIYAVKIIQQRRFNASHAKMFEREVSILRQLEHPNIVRCYDIFPDPSTIFIVMEFVDGGDLLELVLASEGGLPEPEAQSLTRDVCSAMAYLHDCGVVHRDLKPENVLVTASVPRRAKIADFGLAKIVDSATFLRTACGTPAYLAPEVVLNIEGSYTQAVDSWSVGIMVYSMLTMSMPFDDENDQSELRARMRRRTINWEGAKKASREAQRWLRGMLQEDPQARMSMHEALMHPWLYDPYGDGTSGSFYGGGGGAGSDAYYPGGGHGAGPGPSNGFGGHRNGNGATANGNGNGGDAANLGNQLGLHAPLGQRSSDYIYGTESKMTVEEEGEQENKAPSSQESALMALDIPVKKRPVAKDVSMALEESPRKRRGHMEVDRPSPRKKPYTAAPEARRHAQQAVRV